MLSAAVSRHHDNENWQLLEERKNGDADPLHQYLWHPYYIDALALRWYDADTNPGTGVADYYYLHDANFNVTAVTDTSGDVVERYAYSPYGKVTVLDANFAADANGISDIGNTHFYTGRELDGETGLQLNRHRFYSSWLGRWGTRDPIGYDGSEGNLYGYVFSSPIHAYDPVGLGVCIDCHCACYSGRNGSRIDFNVQINTGSGPLGNQCGQACTGREGVYFINKWGQRDVYRNCRSTGWDQCGALPTKPCPTQGCSRSACITGCDNAEAAQAVGCAIGCIAVPGYFHCVGACLGVVYAQYIICKNACRLCPNP